MTEKVIPKGVEIFNLQTHKDQRGEFTELLRLSWLDFKPVQFNYVVSSENVLRGVHVHKKHSDYLIFNKGQALLCLLDLRQDSNTFMQGGLFPFSGEKLEAVLIPPGVAHAFYYHAPAEHIYLVDTYHSSDDELGFRFDDPDFPFSWPNKNPILSKRDENAGSLKGLLASHKFTSNF